MVNALDRLKRICVFIGGPGRSGTGFLITQNRIGTAYHVVEFWEEGEFYRVVVGADANRRECRARRLKIDEYNDAAVLELDNPLDVKTLSVDLGELRLENKWRSYGFPVVARETTLQDALPEGSPIDGVIKDPKSTQGKILLSSEKVGAGNATPLHGYSGSPVVVSGALVGFFVDITGDPDDRRRPAYGEVYARPIEAVINLLDKPHKVSVRSPVRTRGRPAPRTPKRLHRLNWLKKKHETANVCSVNCGKVDEIISRSWTGLEERPSDTWSSVLKTPIGRLAELSAPLDCDYKPYFSVAQTSDIAGHLNDYKVALSGLSKEISAPAEAKKNVNSMKQAITGVSSILFVKLRQLSYEEELIDVCRKLFDLSANWDKVHQYIQGAGDKVDVNFWQFLWVLCNVNKMSFGNLQSVHSRAFLSRQVGLDIDEFTALENEASELADLNSHAEGYIDGERLAEMKEAVRRAKEYCLGARENAWASFCAKFNPPKNRRAMIPR